VPLRTKDGRQELIGCQYLCDAVAQKNLTADWKISSLISKEQFVR